MPSIKFLSSVLCQEVRREADGGAIVVGANMIGPSLSPEAETEIPRIAFYLEAEITDLDEVSIRLCCEETEDSPIAVELSFGLEEARNNGSIDLPEKGAVFGAALVVNHLGARFKGPGDYKLQYKVAEQDWSTIRVFPFPSKEL